MSGKNVFNKMDKNNSFISTGENKELWNIFLNHINERLKNKKKSEKRILKLKNKIKYERICWNNYNIMCDAFLSEPQIKVCQLIGCEKKCGEKYHNFCCYHHYVQSLNCPLDVKILTTKWKY